MSYQHHDRGAPYGGPQDYHMAPPPGRRLPPQNYPPQDRQRGPPPMRNDRDPRYAPRPPQQYSQRPPMESTENLYDGSAYEGSDYDQYDQWPLPSRPFAESPRPRSPGGSPRGSPRRPPQRPQRPEYSEPILDPPRQPARVAPADRSYRRPPPPPQHPQHSHHGSGEWNGDGYSAPRQQMPPPQQYPPPQVAQRPPPPPSQAPIPDYPASREQMLHGNVYGQRNNRPPLGPPPSARRGPPSYFPQQVPVHPIAEEAESMRGSIRNASTASNLAHSSYASSNVIPIGLPPGSSGSFAHSSYASSNQIPIGIPQYYLPGSHDSVPSIPETNSAFYPDEYTPYEPEMHGGASGRESASPEPGALIRQASLGKKSKPTLTTVKSGERIRKDSGERMRKQSGDILRQDSQALPRQQRAPRATPEPLPVVDKEIGDDRPKASLSSDLDRADILDEKAIDTGAAAIIRDATAGKPVPKPSKEQLTGRSKNSDVLSSGTGFLDSSSSESEETIIKKKRSKDRLASAVGKEQDQRSKGRSPLAPAGLDTHISRSIASNLEPNRAFTPENEDLKPAPLGMADQRPNHKRPPRLNVDMDAVRDAEARGSMTSLPDLIRRATKLASNLDRGRTASRLGMNFFEGSESDQEKFERIANANRRSGSISDILASFPPPGSRDEMRRSFGNFSSMLRHSQLPSESDTGVGVQQKKRARSRCCGMPLWLFLMLVIVVVLLVAAAVVVPVMLLVVIPGQKDNGNVSAAELESCRKELACTNGGTNILSNDGACRCLCVSGYTGSTCTQFEEVGCATIDSVGGTNDATVGDDIPRLLNGADTFGIPLEGETLLGLFSSSDMSCTSENALVSFNDVSKRSLAMKNDRVATQQASRPLQQRQPNRAVTNNGITFESGSPSASKSSSPSATSSATPLSSASDATSPAAVDFASIAVLYVFQATSELNSAATAQLNLQEYFSGGSTSDGTPIDPANLSLGSDFSCDLLERTLTLADGSTLGAS